MLTACLLASGAMGLWHTVEFFEKEKVVGEEYFQQWPNVSFQSRLNVMSWINVTVTYNFRSYATTLASLTIGHTSSHGPPSLASSSPPFSSPAPPCASEANARRKNNSICSIWCQSILRSSRLTPTHLIRSRSIQELSTARNTGQRRGTTITKGPLIGIGMTRSSAHFIKLLRKIFKKIHTRCLAFLSISKRLQ